MSKRETYTRTDIADEVAVKFKISREDAAKIVGFTLGSVRSAIEAGLRVELRRFGTFDLKERKAKIVRNPLFPEQGSYTLPPYTAVVFKPAKSLSDKVKEI